MQYFIRVENGALSLLSDHSVDVCDSAKARTRAKSRCSVEFVKACAGGNLDLLNA
jgi:hypothetical protein